MADSGETRHDHVAMKPYHVKLLDEGTIIARCDNVANYSTSGTGVTESLERGVCLNGYGAIKATTTNGVITIQDNFDAVNLTGKNIVVRFYVSDIAAFSSLRLFVFTSTGNYYQYNFEELSGWQEYTLINSDFSTSGTPSWDSITFWRFYAGTSGDALPAYVVLDHIGYDYPGPCIVVPTTDDGGVGIYTNYLPICTANGIEMTHYVVTDTIGDSGVLTLAQCQALYAAGHDISSHSNTHVNLTGLTAEQLASELDTSKAWLIANGFERSAHYLAYPYSAINAAVQAATKQRYRTARNGSLGVHHAHLPPYTSPMWNLVGYGVDDLSTAEFQTLIDNAIVRKGLFVPYWHSLASADFQTEIEYIASKVAAGSLLTMTMSEYWTWICNRYRGSKFWRTKQP